MTMTPGIATRTTAVHPSTSPGITASMADTWTIAVRELQHWRNRPGVKAFGWLFPVITVLMFLALLGGTVSASTGGSYIDFVVPGALAMTMFFGLESTMTAVYVDASKGVADRFRSLPMSGAAVLAGRCVADMINSMVLLAVMVATGLVLGWRPNASAPSIIAALGLLLLLRLGMLWVGMFVGLIAKSQEAVTAMQIVTWPILMVSTVFIDTSTMPRWLGIIAEANPLSTTSTAARELLGNPAYAGNSWFTENAVALAVVVPIALLVVFLPMAANAYRRRRR